MTDRYILIARSWGDGEEFAGKRLFAVEFHNADVAQAALEWIAPVGSEIIAAVFHDTVTP